MDNSGIYVGLDIGTTSIKVIVAERVKGQMNVIGVGSARSNGLSRGVIVDIDKAAETIRSAVRQAEEKASIEIKKVIAGVPANLVKIERCRGMIAVADESKEINNEDVQNVAAAALVQSLPPEREVLDVIPDEFVVDGFDGIKDPRGMVGVRLEMHGTLFTGPKTIIHNTRKALEKAGLQIEQIVIAPLALSSLVLNDGEQDFGSIIIDMGGGQTTAAVIHDHQLKYTYVDQEGGQYITKDISVVLNTSIENAEKLKRDYGYADAQQASDDELFPVDVVGQSTPEQISEQYLAEIIEARLDQIFDKVKQHLDEIRALELPGGIVLTGGVAALPGITDLAAQRFGTRVRVFTPNQMGLRHPSFDEALAVIKYQAALSEVTLLVKSALTGDTRASVALEFADTTPAPSQPAAQPKKVTKKQSAPQAPQEQADPDHKGTVERVKGFFNHFFD
ncbi:cell division protein FtsA [Lactiplantibacillus plantarum]|uniref:cell division protein FtsA n=1 Tax=Lactiplantibacillus plantarum TaxID=1590 RepID=UPI000A17CE57|nr:cell division protein FtsA [Lactiplantibacillus plantarum]ARK34619.1 cell division protein FtsA [Lactiplantibacillus plantarum]QAR75686.1 cell division protein FtsA [Lactiplantibacillus plantarum]QAS30185.1 cell division protein FtsA [Lactiplantibacillus plantarum]QBA76981.1 cell division protein FtsA [Lactiplantibacillus plantarum]RWZ48367.1 cell division protein FtsA [Lactiplantibacillus plantarum]